VSSFIQITNLKGRKNIPIYCNINQDAEELFSKRVKAHTMKILILLLLKLMYVHVHLKDITGKDTK
jgi:hypothetical protein